MVNNYVEKRILPAVSYYGGKTTICRQILQLATPHTTYVECFAGGLSVLLNKYRSDVEIAADISSELVNFYHVLVNETTRMVEAVRQIKCDRLTFYGARDAKNSGDEFTRALNFLMRQRMSFSGCGMTWAEGEGRVGSWDTLPHNLPIVANRLRGVKILLKSAFEVIPEYDSPDTLYYCDPPYYSTTRVSPNVYTCEMGEMDHLRLLRLLRTVQGNVILSGYNHLMYDRELPGWTRVEIDIAAFSSPLKGTKSRRTEILWVKP